jgi:hypothetical protein
MMFYALCKKMRVQASLLLYACFGQGYLMEQVSAQTQLYKTKQKSRSE